jgi:hypothetical protein
MWSEWLIVIIVIKSQGFQRLKKWFIKNNWKRTIILIFITLFKRLFVIIFQKIKIIGVSFSQHGSFFKRYLENELHKMLMILKNNIFKIIIKDWLLKIMQRIKY